MNVSDIEAGCLGLEKEGWFDPWAMLCLLKRGAIKGGAQYISGELVDFTFVNRDDVLVKGVEPGTYEALNEALVSIFL